MRFIIYIIALLFIAPLRSQSVAFDSVFTGTQYRDAVYYQLSTGNKTTVQNNNWHLAFSVQPVQFPLNTLPAVSIRFNEGGNGMSLHQKSFNDTAFFTADTTGFAGFNRLYDTDTNLDTGAFNNGLNISQFDYGWGVYNQVTKNIPGRNVFFLKLSSGIKKFRVVELTFDTLWQIQYANLDNSNLQSVNIPKRLFQGKNYTYLNIETNEIQDREPLSANWDLLFHRYFARDVPGFDGYPSVGVWNNKGIEVAEARGVAPSTNSYQGLIFSKNMSEIGRDWKEFVAPVWELEDSLLYFVRVRNGSVFKIRFTEFAGSATGKIAFEKTLVFNSGTSVNEMNLPQMKVFPNPASNKIQIIADNLSEKNSFTLNDLSGKTLLTQTLPSGFSVQSVDVSTTPAGIYIATLENNGNKSFQRIIIQR